MTLTTAPDVHGATHWGQLTFQLHPPIGAAPGDTLHVQYELRRQVENTRLLLLRLVLRLEGPSEFARRFEPRKAVYKID